MIKTENYIRVIFVRKLTFLKKTLKGMWKICTMSKPMLSNVTFVPKLLHMKVLLKDT